MHVDEEETVPMFHCHCYCPCPNPIVQGESLDYNVACWVVDGTGTSIEQGESSRQSICDGGA